ncbi:MAG: outer membrane beta-barrel protein [Xanthobacteraceae bacterium]|nr:outer membrane beta-barrel protein [Xanthobacteraceae bacterium]
MKRMLLAALVALLSFPAFAADVPVKGPVYKAAPVFNWNGFYGGVHAGGLWLDGDLTAVPGTAGNASGNGFVGGLLAGYNWHMRGNWVFGLEADIGWSNADSTVVLGGPGIVNSELKWNGHVRARLGYAMNRTLLFVAGGLAIAEVEQFAPAGAATVSNTLTGYSIGAGIDHAFAPRWIGRIEYLYDDYGSKIYNYAPFAGGIVVSDYSTHTLRAALMYRW